MLAILSHRVCAELCPRCLPQFSRGCGTILTTNTTAAICTGLIAHSAAAAAHLAGVGLRAIVGGNIAAVVGIGAVTINSGVSVAVAGESQCTAVDGKTAESGN